LVRFFGKGSVRGIDIFQALAASIPSCSLDPSRWLLDGLPSANEEGRMMNEETGQTGWKHCPTLVAASPPGLPGQWAWWRCDPDKS